MNVLLCYSPTAINFKNVKKSNRVMAPTTAISKIMRISSKMQHFNVQLKCKLFGKYEINFRAVANTEITSEESRRCGNTI